MASIQDRSTQDNPAFQLGVRMAGAPEIFRTFPTYEQAREYGLDAEALIRKERRALADPSSTLPPSGDMRDERFLDVLAEFEAERGPHSWHRTNVPGLRKVVGNPTIGQLHPSWIRKYIARARSTPSDRGTPYAWGTIKTQLCIVSSVIKWRAEALNISPPPFVVKEAYFEQACQAEGLHVEDLNNERSRRFEPGEEERLVARLLRVPGPMGAQARLFLQFALATGARLQELVWAQWSEIGPSGMEWHIPRRHSKTAAREMMLTDEALDALRQLRSQRKQGDPRIFHALGNPQRKLKLGMTKSKRQEKEEGKPLANHPRRVSEYFLKYMMQAGLQGFRVHDLRHEGISRFVLSQPDIPIRAVMKMVGHSSLAMLDRYAKLRPNELLPLMRRKPTITEAPPAASEAKTPASSNPPASNLGSPVLAVAAQPAPLTFTASWLAYRLPQSHGMLPHATKTHQGADGSR